MTALCCTAAMAKTLGLPPRLPSSSEATPSGARLGPWFLDIVHARRAKLIVAVEAGTRWAFAYPAAPLASCLDRFSEALLSALVQQGVPVHQARAEVEAGRPYAWARHLDRSVLAHLRQCKEEITWAAADGESLGRLNQRLSDRCILQPRQAWPVRDLLALLGGDPGLVDRRWRQQGDEWREVVSTIQGRTDPAELRLPVARLLHGDRAEAGHEARVLFIHVEGSSLRHVAPRAEPVPRELILDFSGVESVGEHFARELLRLAMAHPRLCVRIEHATPQVAAVLRAAPG